MTEYSKSCPKKDLDFFDAILGQRSSDFIAIHAGGTTQYAQESTEGGRTARVISKGKPFAGRAQGGGERKQIYGTWEYGSGYPGSFGRGVNGQGFPFYFWPVMWDGSAGNDDAYLSAASEYGPPSNNERPGGPLATTAFVSNTTGNTYRILTDNSTAACLIYRVGASCSSFLNLSSIVPMAYPSSVFNSSPVQALQYYRASSIVLTLDGYDNTPIFPFPDKFGPHGDSISDPALSCLNNTIGCSALLVDKAGPVNDFLGFLGAWVILILMLIVMFLVFSSVLCCGAALLGHLRRTWSRRQQDPEGQNGTALLPQTVDRTGSPAVAMSQIHSLPAASTSQHADLGTYTSVPRDEDAQTRRSWDTVTQVGEDDVKNHT